ncbi:MAG: hypothetical protein MUE98_06020 [Rhodobacteraceae bacterium]|jgi:hypothetical protein|nr:hypothetical protein [Paracoccaceae bacterium]
MSAALATILWIASGIALKLALLAQNREYRRDYGRWLGFTPQARLIRKWPGRELGWFAAFLGLAPLFYSMVRP